jgi:hypothetical protein
VEYPPQATLIAELKPDTAHMLEAKAEEANMGKDSNNITKEKQEGQDEA